MRKSTIYLFVLALAVVAMSAIASMGLVASAQNSNSSMTNMNMAKPKPKPKPRRRKPKTVKTGDAATTGQATTMAAPKKTGRCDPMQQVQTDLSGTYTGKVKHGSEAPMDATLTVTGNNFTMTSGSDTHSGRITAVTTCGYTAVTVMMGDLTPPTPSPNPPAARPAMSLRAKKVGNSLTLTSVPGEPQQVMFTTGGGAVRPRKHKPRTRKSTPAAPAKTTP